MIKKIIGIIIVIFIISLLSMILINNIVMNKYSYKIVDIDNINNIGEVDAIVVLGAKVNNKQQISLMLKDRLDKGIELLNLNVSDVILMSGDGISVNNEVAAMKNYANIMSISDEYIKEDINGLSTNESMYNLKNVFNYKKVIIVTQRYHMYRALYIANELGLDAYGVNAREKEYKGQTYRDFREMLARCKDYFLVKRK